MQRFNDGRDWFFEKRYGMFVHWGLYAINGFHEQEIYRKRVERREYAKLAGLFNPEGFDPESWVDLAARSGMEYLVVTAKHIDGFCLWDTEYTDFNVINTPYGKDVIKMVSDACRRRNFPMGIYYSCADMNHINYPNNGRPYEYHNPVQGDAPDLCKYMEYVKNQTRELCSNYGELCAVFWDANVIGHRDPSVNAIVRELQPNAVINDRGYGAGDYATPEREFEREKLENTKRFDAPTEACQALGTASWGYRANESYYTAKFLMQSMDRIFCMGGNYLLNAGPKPDGAIPDADAAVLGRISQWLSAVKESFYGCESASHRIANKGVMATQKGNALYLHFTEDLIGDSVMIEPLTTLPESAVLLNGNIKLECRRDMNARSWDEPMEYVRVCGIPADRLHDEVPVIKLEFAEPPAFG